MSCNVETFKVWLCILLAYLCMGCIRGASILNAPSESDKIVLKVIGELYDVEWKSVDEITVRRSGRFQRIVYFQENEVRPQMCYEGDVPKQIVSALEKDVLEKNGINTSDGIATYTFGIEDTRIQHPTGVEKLLALVIDQTGEVAARPQK